MKTPYKIRYLIKKNYVTDEQIKVYSKENDITLSEAKIILTNQCGPTLQYWDDGIFSAVGRGKWIDVPIIIEGYE